MISSCKLTCVLVTLVTRYYRLFKSELALAASSLTSTNDEDVNTVCTLRALAKAS